MSRPLDGIEARLQMAKDHLQTLHAAVGVVFKTDPVVPATKHDPDTGDHIVWVKHIPDVPPTLGAMLGDVLHNLRSALNHLAFELVRASGSLTPKVEEVIQFPIYEKDTVFKGAVTKLLPGVGPEPIAAIERHQPYNRPDLGRLATLSNRDKHRAPVLILSRTMATLPTFRSPGCSLDVIPVAIFEPLEVGAEVVRLRISGCDSQQVHVEMKGNFIPEVTFEDGTELFSTLVGMGGQCVTIAKELELVIEPPPPGVLPGKHRRKWPSFSTLP